MTFPGTWMRARLGDIAEINPRRFDREPEQNDLVSFVPMAAVEEESGAVDASRSVRWGDVKTKGYVRFQQDDVLFAKITPCMENGKTAVATGLEGGRAVGSTEFHVIRPSEALLSRYLLYFLVQRSVRRNARVVMQGAAGQLRVPRRFLDGTPIPLPPVAEQRRIAAAIEEHLSRLDAAVAGLRRARSLIPQYRAAVLKAAYEGTLVENSGSQSDISIRPLGDLLERIEAGRSFKCDERPPRNGEVGVVKVSAVTWGEFDADESKTVRDMRRVEQRFFIRRGDLLFSRANTIELVGASVLVKSEPKALMLSDKILRLVPKVEAPAAWLLVCLRSPQGRAAIEHLATGNQESMRNIGQDRIRQIPIPILSPPMLEATLAEVDRRLSLLNALDRDTRVATAGAIRLRDSVLKRAFEGKLVPQNPHDEPASVLLDQLRETRSVTVRRQPRVRSRA